MNKRLIIAIGFILLSLPLWSGGWITVRTSIVGTQVVIDQTTDLKLLGHERSFFVEDGLHLIIVGKEGYQPYVDTIRIADGSDRFVPVWMEPISERAMRSTMDFKETSWHYQLSHGLFSLRWVGIGGGIATGLNLHLSLFSMRFGLFTIDPCLWGSNLPFFSGVTHVQKNCLVHPRNPREATTLYNMAIPSPNVQFYYSPMIGFVLPFASDMAFSLSAGPQISWTRVDWSYQTSTLPTTYLVEFTTDPFPKSGFQFDPVWFSVQAGILFSGFRSDLMTYFKYQDGYFLGVEFRF